MLLSEVAFVGGNSRLASVAVRCTDVATALGVDHWLDVTAADQIPDRYRAFVCVKAALSEEELRRLAQRGRVIWDVIDFPPPPSSAIGIYLCSTRAARDFFRHLRPMEVIPHHHCNFSAVPGFPHHRAPGWVGHAYWRPALPGLVFATHQVTGWSRERVEAVYRTIGVGLNFRARRPGYEYHSLINSGIKLINSIGFGLPSISSPEAAYREIDEGCTCFATEQDAARSYCRLVKDERRYLELRQACLAQADRFHIRTITEHYRALLHSL